MNAASASGLPGALRTHDGNCAAEAAAHCSSQLREMRQNLSPMHVPPTSPGVRRAMLQAKPLPIAVASRLDRSQPARNPGRIATVCYWCSGHA